MLDALVCIGEVEQSVDSLNKWKKNNRPRRHVLHTPKGVAGSGQHKRAMAMLFMTTVVFSSVIDAQARAGGADWEVFYSVISSCPMSACMFVFFIAFMQVALMSIFTGIFVEKAMKLAPPDANVLSYMPKYLRIGPCELPKLPNGKPDLRTLRSWRPSVKARPSWTLGQQTRPPKECLH